MWFGVRLFRLIYVGLLSMIGCLLYLCGSFLSLQYILLKSPNAPYVYAYYRCFIQHILLKSQNVPYAYAYFRCFIQHILQKSQNGPYAYAYFRCFIQHILQKSQDVPYEQNKNTFCEFYLLSCIQKDACF